MTDELTPRVIEPTIFELSAPGRTGVIFPESDVPAAKLPAALLRDDLPLPELAEVDVVRHYMRLSRFNYSVDGGFYPLGSCTMKYNPKINEDTCRLPGFLFTHPLQPVETVQGNLALMYQLQEWLKEISGFAGVTLQPAAGWRVTAAKPEISFSHSCNVHIRARLPWTVSTGWRGWVKAKPGRRAVSSLILGLYFIVHEPSG